MNIYTRAEFFKTSGFTVSGFSKLGRLFGSLADVCESKKAVALVASKPSVQRFVAAGLEGVRFLQDAAESYQVGPSDSYKATGLRMRDNPDDEAKAQRLEHFSDYLDEVAANMFKNMQGCLSAMAVFHEHPEEAEVFLQNIEKDYYGTYGNEQERAALNEKYGLHGIDYIRFGNLPVLSHYGSPVFSALRGIKLSDAASSNKGSLVHAVCRSIKEISASYNWTGRFSYGMASGFNPLRKEMGERGDIIILSKLPSLIRTYFPNVWSDMLQGKHADIRQELRLPKTGRTASKKLNQIIDDEEARCGALWATAMRFGNDYY